MFPPRSYNLNLPVYIHLHSTTWFFFLALYHSVCLTLSVSPWQLHVVRYISSFSPSLEIPPILSCLAILIFIRSFRRHLGKKNIFAVYKKIIPQERQVIKRQRCQRRHHQFERLGHDRSWWVYDIDIVLKNEDLEENKIIEKWCHIIQKDILTFENSLLS